MMTDQELRIEVLKKYYEKRKESSVSLRLRSTDFTNITISDQEIVDMSNQLHQKGFIDFKVKYAENGRPGLWQGKITADGVDAIEGNDSDMKKDTTYNVHIHGNHNNMQIGDNNQQQNITSNE